MSAELWAEAFVKAQSEFPPIHKGKTAEIEMKSGGRFSYSYVDLPTILEAVNPVLKKHGLAVAQAAVSNGSQIGVETIIYHESGHAERFGPLFLPVSGDARAAGSAVTYARRYSLCAALGIAADEDDDGEAASVVSDPVEVTPTQWVVNRLPILEGWNETRSRKAWKAAVEALAVETPLASMEDAELVWGHMLAAWEEDTKPFDEGGGSMKSGGILFETKGESSERVMIVHAYGRTIVLLGTEGGDEALDAAAEIVNRLTTSANGVWVVDVTAASVRPVAEIASVMMAGKRNMKERTK